MTEQEAKTKWCPFARVGSGSSGLGSINRDVHHNAAFSQAHCIGSACMAWRWLPWADMRVRELWSKSKGKRVNSAVGDDAEWRLVTPDEPETPKTGYCGLADHP